VRDVDEFLRNPSRLMADDGSDLDNPTNKPELYALPALRRRLRQVLRLLQPAIFDCLVTDRKLVILASASPIGSWNGDAGELDPVAHGSYSSHGRNPDDPVIFSLPFSAFDPPWVIKLGRIEIELAPPTVFAGVVIHECMHVYLDHDFGALTVDEAAVRQKEDEAVSTACALGFREQTAAFLDFYINHFPATGTIMGRLPPL
jgi:hypothetical protein